MTDLAATVRDLRRSQGMTQAELARLSDLSLPSIQNLEAGRGNPSWSSVMRLFDALGAEAHVSPQQADWDALSELGLPLRPRNERRGPRTRALLLRELRKAALELAGDSGMPDRERKAEGLAALLLAIRIHYPSLYRRSIARSPLLASMEAKTMTGRLIKLKRVASQRLAGYL